MPPISPSEVVTAWVEAFNRRDASAAAALYHDDAVNIQIAADSPTIGRTAMEEGFSYFFRAFPDNVTRPVNLFESGEWAILEWEGGGTWRGEFAGCPPNGRSLTISGCGFFQVTHGKIKFQRGRNNAGTGYHPTKISSSVKFESPTPSRQQFVRRLVPIAATLQGLGAREVVGIGVRRRRRSG